MSPPPSTAGQAVLFLVHGRSAWMSRRNVFRWNIQPWVSYGKYFFCHRVGREVALTKCCPESRSQVAPSHSILFLLMAKAGENRTSRFTHRRDCPLQGGGRGVFWTPNFWMEWSVMTDLQTECVAEPPRPVCDHRACPVHIWTCL